jgi:hypothetical protein
MDEHGQLARLLPSLRRCERSAEVKRWPAMHRTNPQTLVRLLREYAQSASLRGGNSRVPAGTRVAHSTLSER